jgi:aminoglycoside phosphotransferase (APT) family kinase protein
MAVEAQLLRAAAGAGVPVPEVLDHDASSIVMTRLDGETIPRRILREPEFARTRERLAAEAGATLAQIQTIPRADIVGLDEQDQLEQFAVVLSGLPDPFPVLEHGVRELRNTRPPGGGSVVVHGDFRLGNLIVGPGGLVAVLDWELAHAGDPLEDLGWFCVKSWRFHSPLPAGGVGTYDQFVGAYEDASGRPVDRSALRWWEALGTLKWGVMCAVQASLHLSGVLRSVELATIGRRVCEVEWDLLGYLR